MNKKQLRALLSWKKRAERVEKYKNKFFSKFSKEQICKIVKKKKPTVFSSNVRILSSIFAHISVIIQQLSLLISTIAFDPLVNRAGTNRRPFSLDDSHERFVCLFFFVEGGSATTQQAKGVNRQRGKIRERGSKLLTTHAANRVDPSRTQKWRHRHFALCRQFQSEEGWCHVFHHCLDTIRLFSPAVISFSTWLPPRGGEEGANIIAY